LRHTGSSEQISNQSRFEIEGVAATSRGLLALQLVGISLIEECLIRVCARQDLA
jgi:hypothetical protein